MTSLHDLRFSPPPKSKSRLRLYIKPCAIYIPDTVRCILALLAQFTSGCLQHCKVVNQQNIRCIASSLKFLWYGSMEWKMEENFSIEWNMEWKIFGMEWKKIASMEYGKIVFHSIPYHALLVILWLLYIFGKKKFS